MPRVFPRRLGVIRTKIIKRHATFASALLRDIRVLFEVLAATTSAVIHFSIAASGLYYDLETGLSKIAQHLAFAPVKARERGKVMKSRIVQHNARRVSTSGFLTRH